MEEYRINREDDIVIPTGGKVQYGQNNEDIRGIG